MRKKIKWFAIFFCCCFFAKAQVDLQNAGTLYITSAADTLYINGNFINTSSAAFTNNGRLHLKQNFSNSQASMPTGTGTLYLNGIAVQSITTTAGSAFNNFTVNKVSGLVTLATDAIVNDILSLTSGKIFLGDNNLTIGTSGSITGASVANYIIAEDSGSLIQQVNNNTTKSFPVGTSSFYIPAGIGLSNTSTTDNFSVRVLDKVYLQDTTGTVDTSFAVNATWVISEATPGGSDASISLQWPAALELTGFNRNSSRLTDYNSGYWDYGPSDMIASGSNPYTVTRSGFNSFSLFTVRSFDLLPVTLLDFMAKRLADNVQLTWKTLNEENVDHYLAERSDDGIHFYGIAQVPSRGNSNIEIYSITDNKAINHIANYRLRIVDIDGHESFSFIVTVTDNNVNALLALLTNPVQDEIILVADRQLNGIFNYTITAMNGQPLQQGNLVIQNGGKYQLQLKRNFRPGVYTLQITNNLESFSFKLIIK